MADFDSCLPRLETDGSVRILSLFPCSASVARPADIEGVIDLGRFGDLIGIEILNFKYHTGNNSLSRFTWSTRHGLLVSELYSDDSGTRVISSYDPRVDALYLRFQSDETSYNQRPVMVTLALDSDGAMIGLQLEV